MCSLFVQKGLLVKYVLMMAHVLHLVCLDTAMLSLIVVQPLGHFTFATKLQMAVITYMSLSCGVSHGGIVRN